MKVLHFIHSLTGGGAEKQLRLLVNDVDKSEFDTSVYCVNDNGNDVACDKVKFYIAKHKSPYSFKYLKEMWDVILQAAPDIVHVWLPASVAIPAMIFSWLQGRKIIFCYRNRMYFGRGLCYPEFLVALLCANRIISNHVPSDSSFAYRWLYKIKKGVVINNAVSVPSEYHKPKEAAVSNPVQFIFIGRLTAQKNPLNLVLAFNELKNNQNWRLDIYGRGELEEEIKKIILDCGLSGRITLQGFVSNPYQIMQRADCLVFPSLHEGMPNVLLEAFSAGLPVIASDIVENRHVVQNSGAVIWVNPSSHVDIADGIEKFITIEGSGKITMREISGGIARSYSLEKMVFIYQQFYKNM